jgi:hypothetical protein
MGRDSLIASMKIEFLKLGEIRAILSEWDCTIYITLIVTNI